jgi:hypothetical protein
MALFRPWNSGLVDGHEGAARVIATRGQVLPRQCARFRGLRGASCITSDGIFVIKDLGSADRRDRCARLTASMAFQLVTLLNEWKNEKYKTKGVIPAKGYGIQSQHNCTECHGDKVPSPPANKA